MEARDCPKHAQVMTANSLPLPSHALTIAREGGRVFRLLGANLGRPALYKDPLRGQGPASTKEEGPRPRRGRRGERMQDIPNSHLEVESRDPLPAVKSNKKQADRSAKMLALVLLSPYLGCGRVPSCALRRAFLMRHGGFPKRMRHGRDQNFTTEKGNRDAPRRRSVTFFRARPAAKIRASRFEKMPCRTVR